ncbi:MAG TPA: ATP-binding cassette domain-containing protein [Candidatus Limnocylindria bacterium]|jgi:ABC-type transporter Mla maintaining outer membrane lipid asymmetry ATPase subunit MlaF|nr:ATP-binding cassette domain-containing protein [Candidatus Limnocylindria bacterium]
MSDDVPLLEFEKVHLVHSQRREVTLFTEFNWRILPGEFWIVGSAQGAGKSALIESAAGRNRPESGTIRLFGEPVFAESQQQAEQVRRRVGLVYDQGGRVFHHLNVAENITLPLRYHRHLSFEEALAELEPLIKAAEIERLLPIGAGRVSRGWAWRIACVRALAMQPELLLLDNPMSGLDREHSRWCRAFVDQLMSGGIGVFKPSAAILACDDLRPWVGVGRQFALAVSGHFRELGDRRKVVESTEPSVRELLERDY